jgi:putative ABC transport system substrate-binding protein
MITRRQLIVLLGAWPLIPAAQTVRRIGVLIPFAESDSEAQARLKAFEREFEKLGWVEGRTARFDRRWAGGDPARMRALAKELVDLRPDAILTHSTPAVAALRQQTLTVPIVFANLSDPVGSGFVQSLRRPGGNATGFINFEASLVLKWLDVLKQVLPSVSRVGLVFNPSTAPYVDFYRQPFEKAAASQAITALAAGVRSTAELENLIASFAQPAGGGLLVMPDTFTNLNRKLIISLAARHRVPTIYPYDYMAKEGGLLAYGIDQVDMYRSAAAYVDRILRGANPGELPVQMPTKIVLVINLKAAKELAIAIPQSLILRADQVIE